MFLLRKSHIKAHERVLANGTVEEVKDYDDKRTKKAEPAKKARTKAEKDAPIPPNPNGRLTGYGRENFGKAAVEKMPDMAKLQKQLDLHKQYMQDSMDGIRKHTQDHEAAQKRIDTEFTANKKKIAQLEAKIEKMGKDQGAVKSYKESQQTANELSDKAESGSTKPEEKEKAHGDAGKAHAEAAIAARAEGDEASAKYHDMVSELHNGRAGKQKPETTAEKPKEKAVKTITQKRNGSKNGVFSGSHVEDHGGGDHHDVVLPAEGKDVAWINDTSHEGDAAAAPVADALGEGIKVPESLAKKLHGKFFDNDGNGGLGDDIAGMISLKMQGINVAHFPDEDDKSKVVSIDLRHLDMGKLHEELNRLTHTKAINEWDRPIDTSKWNIIKGQ